MTRRVENKYFFNRDVSTMFPINSFEPERGLVVHLVVGIHVAVVADQVHVNYVSYLTLTT